MNVALAAPLAVIGALDLVSGILFVYRVCLHRHKKDKKWVGISWWNNIPVPRLGATELSPGNGQCNTVELPGSERLPVFELPVGSIKGGVDGKTIRMPNPVKESDLESKATKNPNETPLLGLGLSGMLPVDATQENISMFSHDGDKRHIRRPIEGRRRHLSADEELLVYSYLHIQL